MKAKRIYKLDINSLYPFVMGKYYYPTRLQEVKIEPSLNYLSKILSSHCVVVDAQIVINEPYIAHKIDGKTCFPVGCFRSVVNTQGARRLLHQKAIKHIYNLIVYQRGKIFDSYIKFFGREKEKYSAGNDICGVKLCKYFMNCLYGKFGQKQETIVDEEKVPNDLIEYILTYNTESNCNGKIITYGGIRRLLEDRGENARNAFVAIAGHVTENARFVLWDYIRYAGKDNVYYCDTDSLFINSRGLKALQKQGCIDDNKLGYFRIEDSTGHCIITTCKDYEFGKEHKQKGISKKAEKLDANKFKQWHFPSLYSYLQKHPDNYFLQSIIKEISGEYDKGIVTRTGEVKPFILA